MNPDFPLTYEQARRDGDRMRGTPVTLQRPVLVFSGYHAWKQLPETLAASLRRLTGAPKELFVPVSYARASTFEHAAQVALSKFAHLAGGSDAESPEVDVVAVSMGGLLSRYMASPMWNGRRLRINRLMTLSTPHRGARLAGIVALDPAAKAMKPGSEFLATLDEHLPRRSYELSCFCRLRDWWVGAGNTAPPGMLPMWLPTPAHSFGHMTVSMDQRIIVEVARRLRGEEPFAKVGQAPPHD